MATGAKYLAVVAARKRLGRRPCIYIRTCIDEGVHDPDISPADGEEKGGLFVARLRPDLRPSCQQHFEGFGMPLGSRPHQGCLPAAALCEVHGGAGGQ